MATGGPCSGTNAAGGMLSQNMGKSMESTRGRQQAFHEQSQPHGSILRAETQGGKGSKRQIKLPLESSVAAWLSFIMLFR